MNTIKREFEYYGNIIPYDVCHTGLKEKSDMEYKNYEYIGSSCVYYINGVKNTSVDLIHFYKEKGEAREIDYYLVKKECWGLYGVKWSTGEKIINKNYIDYFQETGLLSNPDYFTPVYKEVPKFKVGDKVKIIKWHHADGFENVIATITHIDKYYKETPYGLNIIYLDITTWWFKEGEFIHATPSEIAESERPKVGDYCKKVWDDGDVDYFDAAQVTEEGIIANQYYRIKKNGEIKDSSHSVGNGNDAEFNDERYTLSVIPKSEFDEVKQRYLASEKIMIGGNYEVEFNEHSKVAATTIDKFNFTKEFWEAALVIAKHSKASVVVGCNAKGLGTHKWEVTQEQIEKIISKIN